MQVIFKMNQGTNKPQKVIYANGSKSLPKKLERDRF
ncbi:hypothetical protein NIES298_45330 [Microcystis aeruginosa NIES-298]|nr:hypothetical protein NIES298_45330 [Microcystis aeruginosa NIES-298]